VGGRARVEAPWLKLLQAGRLIDLEADEWDKVRASTFGTQRDEWEDIMVEVTGASELPREDVQRILRNRND